MTEKPRRFDEHGSRLRQKPDRLIGKKPPEPPGWAYDQKLQVARSEAQAPPGALRVAQLAAAARKHGVPILRLLWLDRWVTLGKLSPGDPPPTDADLKTWRLQMLKTRANRV